MLAIPRMARTTRPTRVVRAKLWAMRNYTQAMLRRPLQALSFVLFDPELDNYTYALANVGQLSAFLAATFRLDQGRVDAYLDEIEHDAALREMLNARLRLRPDRKPVALYGRRIGWYALVRAFQPAVIVETGVHDGLGSSVLLRAIQRNHAEGGAGRLYGIDINPHAGWLIPDRLREHLTLIIEDSATALPRLTQRERVDLLIHDSDHSYAHELKEFELVADGLSADGIILSDNAHATTALRDFSAQRDRVYAFWKEQPKAHFYPGAGIGVSVR